MEITVAVRLREVGLTNFFLCKDIEVKIGDLRMESSFLL